MNGRNILLSFVALGGSLVACGEESYCDRVDCDEAAASTGTTTPPASSGSGDEASSSSGSGAGSGDGGGGGDQGGSGPGGGGAGPFAVTPGDTKVGILRPLDFDASVEVEWSVVEEGGGTIDDEGVYVSPEEPGTFHVVATSSESGEEVEVEVTVVGLALDVAGGIPGGAGNLDGIASRARFRSPRGAASFAGDDIVVADTGNHTLRLLRDGEVTTIAGSPGLPGITSGVGSSARFTRPTGVTVVGEYAYVVDSDGACIRRVEIETGDVTTFAGACNDARYVNAASGSASRFLAIQSIAPAHDGGALYVCDAAGSGDPRRVDLETGGTFDDPVEGLSVGAPCHMSTNADAGVIYLHTGIEAQVRIFDGTLTAFDLAPIPGSDETLAGLAYTSKTLYAFDRERPDGSGTPWQTTLHAFELGDDRFVEIGGGANDYVDGPLASARFLTPGFLVPAPTGALLFSDVEAHTIRRISFSGADEVETVVGSPSTIYARDGGATTARLLGPAHVALSDDDGALFVAGVFHDNVIRRIDAGTRAVERFSGVPADYVFGSQPVFDLPVDGQAGEAVFGIVFDVLRVGDSLYVIDSSWAVRRVSLETGAVDTIAGGLNQSGFEDGVGSAARFDFDSDSLASGLATDGVDLFVADAGNHAIRRVDLATGEVTTLAGGTAGTADGTGEDAQFEAPAGLAYDAGILYVADAGAHTVRFIDVGSGEVTTLTGRAGLPGDADGDANAARFKGPYRLAADGIGNLYVTSIGLADDVPHTIRRIRLDDVETMTVVGDDVRYGFADGPLPATLGCPAGLAIDGAGDLVFADACDGAIGAIRPL